MDIQASRVLQELSAIAFCNIVDYLDFDDDNITLKDSKTIERDKLAAIAKVSIMGKGCRRSVDLQLYDKMSALKVLAKYAGITGDLNSAIATLARYGLILSQDSEGRWTVCDEQAA